MSRAEDVVAPTTTAVNPTAATNGAATVLGSLAPPRLDELSPQNL